MDALRPYFGLSDDGAHTAATDVEQSGAIIIKFLKYHKALFKKDKFRNSMREQVTS
jgi:hypothetical protein